MPLEREGVVDAVAGAESAVRGGVGIDRTRDQPHRAEGIISAERVSGHRGQENLLATIRAAIHQDDGFAADDLAIARHGRAYANVGVFAKETGEHLFLARIDQPDRPSARPGKQGSKGLDREIEFEAEAAADRRHGDANPGGRHAQQARGCIADGPGNLGRRLDMEAPVFITCDHRARLEGDMVLAADPEAAFDDLDIGPGKRSVDVAANDGGLPCDVASAGTAFEQNLVAAPVGMHERSVRSKRIRHGENHGQRFNLDVNCRKRGLSLHQRVRRDRGDRLAVVADHVAGKERVVGDADPDHAGRIGSGHDGAHTGHAGSLGGVEAGDPA